jgi:uncharacterized membrane protein YgcG
MSDGIRGLISRDGQVRRRALDELGRSLEYYIPPELREALLQQGLPSFRDGGMVTAAEALMATTPQPAAPAPQKPAPKKQPAQPQYKIERVIDGNGKYQTRFVAQA